MVLVKNWPFFHLLFKGNIGKENVFYDILERKNASLGYKNKNFKKGKNCQFSKGVSPCVWSKIDNFSILFFFLAIQARKMCFKIFQNEKTPFQAIKTRSSRSEKNCQFSKGVTPWFWSKIGQFSIFYFGGNKGQENVFYDILQRQNVFLSYKNQKFKKSKNCYFSKGVSPWFWSKTGHFFKFFPKAIQAR